MTMHPTIKAVVDRYKLGRSECWQVQGNWIIKHSALERIAAGERVAFDPPQIIRSERDECVVLVTGRLPAGDYKERVEWSFGEACIDLNYKVSGKQAGYPYAMAEKRGKDRVILKLLSLHGLAYSEEEADEFKDQRPRVTTETPVYSQEDKAEAEKVLSKTPEEAAAEWNPEALENAAQGVETRIRACATHDAIKKILDHPETKAMFHALTKERRAKVYAVANKRDEEIQAKNDAKPARMSRASYAEATRGA